MGPHPAEGLVVSPTLLVEEAAFLEEDRLDQEALEIHSVEALEHHSVVALVVREDRSDQVALEDRVAQGALEDHTDQAMKEEVENASIARQRPM